MLDLYHYYKNTGRYILYLKYSINFFYYTNILELGKLTLFYDVANINDLNSINILSHLFFFKYSDIKFKVGNFSSSLLFSSLFSLFFDGIKNNTINGVNPLDS